MTSTNMNVYAALNNILDENKKKCVRLLEELPENFDKNPRELIIELANVIKDVTDPEEYRDDLLTLAAFLVIIVISDDRNEAKRHLETLKQETKPNDRRKRKAPRHQA